jgi:hypothetical protein
MNSQEYKEHIQGLTALELMNEVERNFSVATETGFTSTRDKHAAMRRHKMALEELRGRE